ncbi:3916_t:CDS:1, partial [Acaulospora morrowiae]
MAETLHMNPHVYENPSEYVARDSGFQEMVKGQIDATTIALIDKKLAFVNENEMDNIKHKKNEA